MNLVRKISVLMIIGLFIVISLPTNMIIQNVKADDTIPPQIYAEFTPIDVEDDEGLFEINYYAIDDYDPDPIVSGVIEACSQSIPVNNNQLIQIELDGDCEYIWDDGILKIEGAEVYLNVTASDWQGNWDWLIVQPVFDNPDDDFIWQSMNGPAGGDLSPFGQNPYSTDEIYAGCPMGLYRSKDNGTNFEQVGNTSIRNITSIHFSEEFAVVGADHLYSFEYTTDESYKIHEENLDFFISGNDIYLMDIVIYENKFEISAYKNELISASDTLVTDETTQLFITELIMNLEKPLTQCEVSFPHFFMVGEKLLVSIAVKFPDSVNVVYDTHDIILINTTSGVLEMTTPTLIENFTIATIEQDPENERHLLLGARSKKFNDDFGIRTFDKLVFESTDGGKTWVPFSSVTDYSFSAIKDIDFMDDGIYFARVGDFILKVNPDDHEDIETFSVPKLTGGRGRLWLWWIEFDLDDPNIVYGGLDMEFGDTGFIRSIDGMSTWELVGNGVPSSYPSNIVIHPTDSSIIATSGILAHFPHITRDFGVSWHLLTPKTTMGDEIVFDPHDPNHMILITESSFLYESWDMGDTWERFSVEFSGTRVFDLEATEQGTSSIYASLHGTGISRVTNLELIDILIQAGDMMEAWNHLPYCPDYVYDIEIDPDNSEIIYATYSPKIFENYSSVWKYNSAQTENLGWTKILNISDSSGATSIAVDTEDTDRIYSGITGEPGKIYVTENRGDNWEHLAEQLTFSTIHEMAVDPNDDAIVYAAPWGGGLYKSIDFAETWELLDTPTISISAIVMDSEESDHFFIGDRTRPVVYETYDGGYTWDTIVEFDSDEYYRISAMCLHNEELYVSVFNIQDKQISVYNDGPMSGTTFRIKKNGHPFRLTGDMKRAVIGFTSNNNDLFAISHINGVFKLNHNSWNNITSNLPDMGFNGISIKDDIIYLAGGCDVGLYGTPRINDPIIVNNIYMSSDYGENWLPLLGDDLFNGPIKKVIPIDNEKLIVGTNTGVYISIDSGQTWSSQNSGLDFLSIGALVSSEDNIYAGTLGGGVFHGTLESDDLISWDETMGPTPHIYHIQIKIDPTDSNIIYATAFPGGVFKSMDKGVTWNECNFALPSFEVIDPLIQGYYSLEINPFDTENLILGIYGHGIYISNDGANTWFPMYGVFETDPIFRDLGVRRVKFDPSSMNKIFMVSDKGVFRSLNAGRNWEEINFDLTTKDVLSIDITESGTVFIGTNGYGIYRFNNDTFNWTHLDKPLGFGIWTAWDRRIYQYSALMFDPNINGKVYFGQFPGGFFISEDNGETWECSSLGLGNDGIFSLKMHPNNSDILFAGTYNGIWRSNDNGYTWFDTSTGMPGEQWPFCVAIDDENPLIMYTATKNGMNKGFMSRNTFGGVVMKSTDGGETWFPIMNGLKNMSEYYQIIIYPKDHEILFLSSTYGVFISQNGGDSWEPFNKGMPVEYFILRDNVAQNLQMTPDMNHLIFAITGYGVWKCDISSLVNYWEYNFDLRVVPFYNLMKFVYEIIMNFIQKL
jgi:photosystem II stability/assembly factor-like uncharacterized protein